MLHQDLTSLDTAPLDGGTKWLVPLLLAAASGSGAALFFLAGEVIFAGLFLAGFVAMLVIAFFAERRTMAVPAAEARPVTDLALVGASLDLAGDAAVLTDRDGRAIVANAAYRQRFASQPGLPAPGSSALDPVLGALVPVAMASGDAEGRIGADEALVRVHRTGAARDMLLWRFPAASRPDLVTMAARRIAGATGERLAAGGVLAALVGSDGRLLSVNPLFAERALPRGMGRAQPPRFDDLILAVDGGGVRLSADGGTGPTYRLLQVPLDPSGEAGATTMMLVEGGDTAAQANSSTVQALLDILPIGLGLVDRDGRFLTMNKAFRLAGGIDEQSPPTYPGDLVTKEDKAAVAEAVRRNARGPAMSGDLPVRLKHNPTEPVALTVAGLRGLGDAVVLLLLKDNSEEAKLKRQVAQATKMQAVGQLAGGVAHDFNNILTAIIGHCDLMLMRHTPGDSDYDDIQQIKSNSNRAAGLTRQLLAFSRQQTLRPQTLQLPDVVSEVSHLLKRLLGETVQLVVKHGRGVGPVRADPGQLEQVIVNLAVNGRDAMASKGGGTLTIQTYAVRADQVADLGSDILPVADYSALAISDTGVGIPPSVLGKVFEPFFTTKEVGKGTGLGLSTVYGIVKQSGGFIFADSRVGEGTRFTIYLPVHQVEEGQAAAPARLAKDDVGKELWGTGTILLVEDEPMVRTVAERALARHGYKVLTANNGEEALETLGQGHDIALLISDVVMPMMDGPTMVREARKTHPHVPILFMSGYAEEQLRKSIDIDNVAFLPKPFAVQELAEAVRSVLAAHAAGKK